MGSMDRQTAGKEGARLEEKCEGLSLITDLSMYLHVPSYFYALGTHLPRYLLSNNTPHMNHAIALGEEIGKTTCRKIYDSSSWLTTLKTGVFGESGPDNKRNPIL